MYLLEGGNMKEYTFVLKLIMDRLDSIEKEKNECLKYINEIKGKVINEYKIFEQLIWNLKIDLEKARFYLEAEYNNLDIAEKFNKFIEVDFNPYVIKNKNEEIKIFFTEQRCLFSCENLSYVLKKYNMKFNIESVEKTKKELDDEIFNIENYIKNNDDFRTSGMARTHLYKLKIINKILLKIIKT
jgi:hypothetical protein